MTAHLRLLWAIRRPPPAKILKVPHIATQGGFEVRPFVRIRNQAPSITINSPKNHIVA